MLDGLPGSLVFRLHPSFKSLEGMLDGQPSDSSENAKQRDVEYLVGCAFLSVRSAHSQVQKSKLNFIDYRNN